VLSESRFAHEQRHAIGRVVGITLVLLGVWVLVSVVPYLRGKGEFRMRSRWMLVFDGVRYGCDRLQARIHGHQHEPIAHASQQVPAPPSASG
jgi:hypothetical protein